MKYKKYIYFGNKKVSEFGAVKDIFGKGVNTSKEVGALAFAMLLDYLDGYTKNHYGKKIKFTSKLWNGRWLILNRLANKHGGKRYLNLVKELKTLYSYKKLSKQQIRNIIYEIVKSYKLPLKKFRL